MNPFAKILCVALSTLLLVPPVGAQAASSEFQIKVVDDKSPKTLTVAVTDMGGSPVPDAAVVIRMPDAGPTAVFGDGTHSAVAYTDASGKASVNDIRWSSEPGLCTLRITATRGNSHAGILFERNIGPMAALAVAAPIAPPP